MNFITKTIIATLITSVVILFVRLLTHVKNSKCGNMDIEFTNTALIPTNNIFNQQNSTNIIK